MSFEILEEYVPTYKKHEGTDHHYVSAHMLGHVFMDWMSAWIAENPKNKLAKKLNTPNYGTPTVKKAFNLFISKLKDKSVEIPEALQEEALKEYLDD